MGMCWVRGSVQLCMQVGGMTHEDWGWGEEGIGGVSSWHDPRIYMLYTHLQYVFYGGTMIQIKVTLQILSRNVLQKSVACLAPPSRLDRVDLPNAQRM